MICGKCNALKRAAYVEQTFPCSAGQLIIHNIPAMSCNCQTVVVKSVQDEVNKYVEMKKNAKGIEHHTYLKV